jgi:hypothetical protein
VQRACVYREGTCIAGRWDDLHQHVILYRLPGGFVVELNYDVAKNDVTFLFPFEAGSEDDRLPDYAMFVKLPDWVSETE